MTQTPETNSYKGWLNSDSFIKRALAVTGYGLIGQFFLTVIGVAIGAGVAILAFALRYQ